MALHRRSSLPAPPALALVTLAACSSAPDRPDWDDGTDASYAANLNPPALQGDAEAAPPDVNVVAPAEGVEERGSPDPRGGGKEILPLIGRLQGTLGGFEFDQDGTSNLGEAVDWQAGGSLVLRVTVQSETGAGMLLLTIEGGPNHPLMTEGEWTSERQWEAEALDPGAPLTWFRSCAGPDLSDCDWLQPPVGFTLRATADPSEPGRILIEADVSLANDERVTATMSFVEPV